MVASGSAASCWRMWQSRMGTALCTPCGTCTPAMPSPAPMRSCRDENWKLLLFRQTPGQQLMQMASTMQLPDLSSFLRGTDLSENLGFISRTCIECNKQHGNANSLYKRVLNVSNDTGLPHIVGPGACIGRRCSRKANATEVNVLQWCSTSSHCDNRDGTGFCNDFL